MLSPKKLPFQGFDLLSASFSILVEGVMESLRLPRSLRYCDFLSDRVRVDNPGELGKAVATRPRAAFIDTRGCLDPRARFGLRDTRVRVAQ